MKKYKLVAKKGEGTFSEVVKAQNVEVGSLHAIKCMKSHFGSIQEVNNLREIQALKKLTPHPNIVGLHEVLYDKPTGRLAMVFELMDANLYDLISGRRTHLDSKLVVRLGYQLFTALKYMHENGIFHRDIKPENILVNETRDTLKVADLGSARGVTHKKPFTEYIATRWYRAPECLITDGYYGAEMDIWGSGCVIFELVSLYPLFPGADETDQINRIHKIVGTPSPATVLKFQSQGLSSHSMKFQHQKGVGIKHFISHASPECVDLINQTLIYDYSERITSKIACEHAYFEEAARELNEKAKTPEVRRDAFLVGDKEKELNPPLAEKERNPQEPSTSIETKRKKLSVVDNNEGKKDHTIKNKASKPKHSGPKESNVPVRRRRPMDTNKITQSRPVISQNHQQKKPTRRRKQINSRLPGNEKQKPTNKNAATTNDLKKRTDTTKRRNKYSNVSSSGYGRSYKPSVPSRKKTDSGVSKDSTVSTKTGSTSTGHSLQNRPKPLNRRKKNTGLYKPNPTRLPALKS